MHTSSFKEEQQSQVECYEAEKNTPMCTFSGKNTANRIRHVSEPSCISLVLCDLDTLKKQSCT